MNRLCNLFPPAIRAGMALTVFLGCCGWAIAQEQDQMQGGNPLQGIEVLDLETAAEVALAENPTLAVAQARVIQAREAVRQAQSDYWPRLDASGSASRVDLADNEVQRQLQPLQTFNPQVTMEDPQEYYSASLTATWLLFNGFARKFSVAAAQYGEQLTAAARDDAQRLLLSSVTAAFLSAQLAQENIVIANADLAFNQRQLKEARLRYEVGTGALSDVLNFRVRANSAQAQRIQARQNFQTSLIGLAALLGLSDAHLPENIRLADLSPATPAELDTPQIPKLVETAYQLRPDLQQGDWAIQQAQAGVKVARGDYFPTISLTASLDGQRPDDPDFENEDFGNTVALNLTYNIFAGWYYDARYQEAKARVMETEKNQQNIKVNVTSQVRTAAARVLSAQEQMRLQQANTELVQQNRDLVEKEYKAGVGSLVRLNEAQRDLTAAQVNLASARVALRQAWYDLQTATGEILNLFKP